MNTPGTGSAQKSTEQESLAPGPELSSGCNQFNGDSLQKVDLYLSLSTKPMILNHTSPLQVDYLLFESRPGVAAAILPDAPRFTVVAVTQDLLKSVGMKKEDIVGKGHFEPFPDSPEDGAFTSENNIRAAFEYVIEHKKPYELPVQRYDIPNGDGTFTERYWKPQGSPVLSESGELLYIIHAPVEVTDQVKAARDKQAHQELKVDFKKLEESEARFRSLLTAAPIGIGIYRGRDLVVEMANATMIGLIGKGNDIIGKRFSEVIPELEQQAILKILDEVFVSGKSYETTEAQLDVYRDGQLIRGYYDFSYTPIFDAAGKVYAILNIATEVSERVARRKSVEESESMLRRNEQRQSLLLRLTDLLRTISDPLAIQYEAAGLVARHLGACRSGYAEDGGDGKTVTITTDYTHDVPSLKGSYSYDNYGADLLQAFHQGQTVVRHDIAADPSLSAAEKAAHAALGLGATVNVPLLRNGQLIAIFFVHHPKPYHWTDEELLLIQEVAERTWEAVVRARAEQALRKSEERFRLMANSVPQSIWITDAAGNVEFLNQHWWNYIGQSYANTSANDIAAKHLHPDDAPVVMQAFTAALRTGQPFEVEQRNRSKDGEYRWFLNRATPYRDPVSGQITKWFGIGIDIHDRKLAEEALRHSEEALEQKVEERTRELEKANQELQRSNQNLEEFAYAASHDMKEPIRKIHFFADRLKERLEHKMEEEDLRYFGRLEAGAKRMSTLIDDLLLYSHVNRGLSTIETVDLNQMLAFVLDDLELHIEQKGARVAIGPLPTIQGRPRQLQQLFENLIGNALKYSKEGAAPVVGVSSQLVNGSALPAHILVAGTDTMYHLVAVKDNGIGFEQADAERIFNVFTRLHGNAEYRGTGVGLSIAQKIVENHGGYIWAESRPGEGATFFILLPTA